MEGPAAHGATPARGGHVGGGGGCWHAGVWRTIAKLRASSFSRSIKKALANTDRQREVAGTRANNSPELLSIWLSDRLQTDVPGRQVASTVNLAPVLLGTSGSQGSSSLASLKAKIIPVLSRCERASEPLATSALVITSVGSKKDGGNHLARKLRAEKESLRSSSRPAQFLERASNIDFAPKAWTPGTRVLKLTRAPQHRNEKTKGPQDTQINTHK
eukprot:9503891-Pyramimonas_sp.AAC.5